MLKRAPPAPACRDWRLAFERVIPPRKRKHEGEGSEGEEGNTPAAAEAAEQQQEEQQQQQQQEQAPPQ